MKAKTNTKSKGDWRRAMLAKVHIAKKDLGIDDEDYRDILQEQFGVRSAGALNDRELEQLVRWFQSKG
jgi:phage gp16-like protein